MVGFPQPTAKRAIRRGVRRAPPGLGPASAAGRSVGSRSYKRLRYARQHYYLVGGGTRLGPQTRLLSVQAGRLEATELDDRGLVYVRLGEPDRTATFSGVQSDFRRLGAPDLVVSPTCYQPNVTWAYDLPGGTRLYHFSSLEGSANWWLIENLHDVYRCGDPTSAISNGSQAVLDPGVGHKSAPISQIAWLVLGDLYLSRAALDADYGTLSHRIVASGPTGDDEREGLRSVGGGAYRFRGSSRRNGRRASMVPARC